MEKLFPVLTLMGIFVLQTVLILIFLPLIWEIMRITIIEIRFLDQGVKALFIGFLGLIWLYVFRLVYYMSYHWLKRCK